MADTTDELIVVVEDELITAETTNKNNKYLETLMTNYAGELRQYLDNQLQTLENEIQDDLTNLETTLQGSIDELEAWIDSISFAPDYSRAVSFSPTNGGAVGFDGYIAISMNASNPESHPYAAINGIKFTENRSGNASAAGYLCSGITMVRSTDVLTWNASLSVAYKIPFVGGSL